MREPVPAIQRIVSLSPENAPQVQIFYVHFRTSQLQSDHAPFCIFGKKERKKKVASICKLLTK